MRLAWHMIASFLLASGCLPSVASASFTASSQPCEVFTAGNGPARVLARCQVGYGGIQGSIELYGLPPNLVSAAVFRDASGTRHQEIPLAARPFIDPENVSISVRDMNFDGWPDFGLRDFARNGPNEPWSFWLWYQASRQFIKHEALSALPNPEASSTAHEVRSYEVDLAGQVTVRSYIWQHGELVPASP